MLCRFFRILGGCDSLVQFMFDTVSKSYIFRFICLLDCVQYWVYAWNKEMRSLGNDARLQWCAMIYILNLFLAKECLLCSLVVLKQHFYPISVEGWDCDGPWGGVSDQRRGIKRSVNCDSWGCCRAHRQACCWEIVLKSQGVMLGTNS